MENILKSSLYEAFAEASDRVYIYVTDMKTGQARWSMGAVWYFDMPGEYMDDPANLWGSKIHPDDRDAYFADIDDVFTGKSNKHSCQYRAMNRYGEYVWLECKGTMIYDEDGNMSIFAGLMTRLDGQNKYDSLTGLLSRYEFYELGFDEGKGSVLLVGIDDFRKVIGMYGYSYGDEILVTLAKRLSELCGKDKGLYRFNGDEFIVVMPDASEEQVIRLFLDIRREAGKLLMSDGRKVELSLSAGVTEYPVPQGGRDELINRVEHALDYVKKNNKGGISYYTMEIERQQLRSAALKEELKHSIDNDFAGFELYFQPWVDAKGDKILGCEALIRWKGERIKDAGPMEFIPILEESGDIIPVGRWVMKQAMQQQKEWQQRYGDFIVSFNVSYQQFLQEGYVEELVQAAKDYQIKPEQMVLELTESCRVENTEKLSVVFSKLRENGFNVALDDFGTAYASLELLKKLPADNIKIEHSFVRELGENGHDLDYAIIETLMFLSKRANCDVVVEGVENQAVDKIIRKMDATYLQGYYYSRPVCKEDFEKLMDGHQ